MPRPPADPVARLPLLVAARKKLGRRKLVVNAADMAKLAGLSWVALKKYHIDRDPDFPVVRRGSEGVPWEFDAAAALDHMIKSARTAEAERERRRASVSRLAGLGSGSDGPPLSGGAGEQAGSGSAARHMLEDARALSHVIDVRAKLRAEMVAEGRLIERASVDSFLWRWLGALQTEVLAIENRIDRAGRLDAETRLALKDELANVLVGMRARLEELTGPRDGIEDRGAGNADGAARRRRVPVPDRGRRAARAGASHPA